MDHIYTPADSPLIKQDQSCLSFILDNFLPIVRKEQDSEVSLMSRVLIASLSDCHGYPTIQNALVYEIHEAIVRALSLPECREKQTRLQVLIGLYPTIIESPLISTKFHIQRNNMYRILLNHDIMMNLSKLPQYKDLSNLNTVSVINTILRTLEILLRLTVAPGPLSKRIVFSSSNPHGGAVVSRRYYPRMGSRVTSNIVPNVIGGDNVLRDIIRNVLSDRRHAIDFIFNTDNIFAEMDESSSLRPDRNLPNSDNSSNNTQVYIYIISYIYN